MLRWIKYGVGAVVVVGVAGLTLLGSNFGSYISTSTNAARQAARNAVPVEFELRRASDMIEAILPDLQSQVRMIAQEEVEVAALTSDIEGSRKRLNSEQRALASLRTKVRTQQVSYTVNGRNIERGLLTEQLHQRFERFKQGELAFASKQKLLEKRNDGLTAALAMLDKMRHRKAELEQKVESLAAQHRLVQASAIESGHLVDGSRLSKADQLLDQIETRLAVAQRVLTHEQDIFAVSAEEEFIDEEQLMTELDEYFGAAPSVENGAAVVGLSKNVDVTVDVE
jgi:hypothetical protein